MRRANYGNGQFVDQFVFQTSSDLGRTSLSTFLSGAYRPGILNASQLTVAPSGSSPVLTLTAAPGFAVLFGNGIYGELAGTANGVNNNSITLDFTSFIPTTGTATVYVSATTQPLNTNAANVVGPPLGHPDYNPNFSPYVLYSQIWDTLLIQVLSSNTTIDNVAVVELFRVVLSPGMVTIPASSINYSYRPIAVPLAFNAQNGLPPTSISLGNNNVGFTFLGQPQTGLFSTTTGSLSLYAGGSEYFRSAGVLNRSFFDLNTEPNINVGIGMGATSGGFPLRVRTNLSSGDALYVENPNSNGGVELALSNLNRTWRIGAYSNGNWHLFDTTSNAERLQMSGAGQFYISGPTYIQGGNNLYLIASPGLPNDSGDLVFVSGDSSERARIFSNPNTADQIFFSVLGRNSTPNMQLIANINSPILSITNGTADRGYAIDSVSSGPNAIGYFNAYNPNALFINTVSGTQAPAKSNVVINGYVSMPGGAGVAGTDIAGRYKVNFTLNITISANATALFLLTVPTAQPSDTFIITFPLGAPVIPTTAVYSNSSPNTVAIFLMNCFPVATTYTNTICTLTGFR